MKKRDHKFSRDNLRIAVAHGNAHNFLAPSGRGIAFGGSEVRAAAFATMLHRRGHEVTVVVNANAQNVCIERSSIPLHLVTLTDSLHDLAVLSRRQLFDPRRPPWKRAASSPMVLPMALNSIRYRTRALLTYLQRASRRKILPGHLDVVVCVGADSFCFEAAAAAYQKGIPFVWMLSNTNDLLPTATLVQQVRVRFMIRFAVAIFAQTQDQIELLPLDLQRRVRLLRNPAPHLVFEPPVEQHAPAIDRPYALWVGRRDADKNPDGLAKLARALPSSSFVMVLTRGEGEVDYDAYVAALPTNVRVIDGLPFWEVHRLIEGANVFVSTSKREGLANTLVQAATCGVPFASLYLDPDGLLDRYGLGTNVEGDHMALADYVRARLAESPNRGACPEAHALFSPDVVGSELIHLLRQIVGASVHR